MYRGCLILLVTGLGLGASLESSRADEKASLQAALALQETLHKTVQQAEPSIACILVSRSESYRQLEGGPPADNPGKLGTFTPRIVPRTLPERDSERITPEQINRLNLADPSNVPESYGSGVLIDERGLVLTNYHVVREATKIYVRLPGRKGSYADIHAADPRSDLAVLRLLDASLFPLPAIKLGDGDRVKKMDFVVSLANPFAAGFPDGSPSASWGIISNIRRRAPGTPREEERTRTLHHYGTLLQTDARLNFGCSGGALLNLHGELVGLTTALAALSGSETAGGFALPMTDRMKAILAKLKTGEEVEYGFLGVQPYPNFPRGDGVPLQWVTEGSPAYLAGVRVEDRILEINGLAIQDIDELFLTVGTLFAGSKVRVVVRSPNRPTRTVTMTLAKFYVAGPGPVLASTKPPALRGIRVDYTSVLYMRRTSPGGQATYREIPAGVVVREVQSGSAAATAQLHLNEVITHVNNQAVNTPAEFYREAAKLGPTEPLELTLAASEGVRSSPKVIIK